MWVRRALRERGAAGPHRHEHIRKFGTFGLLMVDKWVLDKPDIEFRSMLLELMELMELSHGTASTVFCIQLK